MIPSCIPPIILALYLHLCTAALVHFTVHHTRPTNMETAVRCEHLIYGSNFALQLP